MREAIGSPAYRVKQMSNDEIDAFLSSCHFYTKPTEIQKRALVLGLLYDEYLYAIDMGLGKTKLILDLFANQKKMKQCSKALITVNQFVVQEHWLREIEKHRRDLYPTLITGTADDKVNNFCSSKADIVICTNPWLSRFLDKANDDGLATLRRFDFIAIDEARTLGVGESKTIMRYIKHLSHIKKKYLLTGTPLGNNTQMIWGYYNLLGKKYFGTNFFAFRNKYYYRKETRRRRNGLSSYYYIQKSNLLPRFSKRLWKRCVRWEEEENPDGELKPPRYIRIDYRLSNLQRTRIASLITETPDGKLKIDEKLSKVREITAGINLDEHQMDKQSKKHVFLSLMEEMVLADKQVIVWVWLKKEIIFLLDILQEKGIKARAIYGATTDKQAQRVLDDWRTGDLPCIVANPLSLGMGVNLIESNNMVFFSSPLQYDVRRQAEKRIHRMGQKRVCNIYDLLCQGSIDDSVFAILKRVSKQNKNILQDGFNWQEICLALGSQ